MKKLLISTAMLLAAGTSAFAADWDDRLDGVEPPMKEETATAAPTIPTHWDVERKASVMDNGTDEIIVSQLGTINRGEDALWLAIRCLDNTTNVLIGINSQFHYQPFSDWSGASMRIKIGSGDARTLHFAAGASGDTGFANNPIPLLREMAKADTLAVEMKNNRNFFISTFNLDGIEQVVEEVATTCNWKL